MLNPLYNLVKIRSKSGTRGLGVSQDCSVSWGHPYRIWFSRNGRWRLNSRSSGGNTKDKYVFVDYIP